MDAMKLIGTSHDGKLTVNVPDEYDNKELEIMIVSSKEKEKEQRENQIVDERKEKFMKIFGSAKHPDFPMTKYDTYDQ